MNCSTLCSVNNYVVLPFSFSLSLIIYRVHVSSHFLSLGSSAEEKRSYTSLSGNLSINRVCFFDLNLGRLNPMAANLNSRLAGCRNHMFILYYLRNREHTSILSYMSEQLFIFILLASLFSSFSPIPTSQ